MSQLFPRNRSSSSHSLARLLVVTPFSTPSFPQGTSFHQLLGSSQWDCTTFCCEPLHSDTLQSAYCMLAGTIYNELRTVRSHSHQKCVCTAIVQCQVASGCSFHCAEPYSTLQVCVMVSLKNAVSAVLHPRGALPPPWSCLAVCLLRRPSTHSVHTRYLFPLTTWQLSLGVFHSCCKLSHSDTLALQRAQNSNCTSPCCKACASGSFLFASLVQQNNAAARICGV